ncbi:hypothetical protein G2W53_025211 [Senna tora]|uniref:Uncharacterized protein n=1 Tax=Senna tora TaxID=362788 RepID=A0A834WHN9_9FABA|nr:hypothetical protein G2W53_025211 [Senna tora]
MVGRAVPLTTPHPTVCGQFPSSHSPRIGNAADVSRRMASSFVNIRPHLYLIPDANIMAENPITDAIKTDTTADNFARQPKQRLPPPQALPARRRPRGLVNPRHPNIRHEDHENGEVGGGGCGGDPRHAEAEVNADWMNEGVGYKVGEEEGEVGVSHTTDVGVLVEEEKDFGDEFGAVGSEGLGAEWLHPQSETGEKGVAGDVGEGDGEGAGGELEVTQVAQEEHGDDGA